MVMNKVEVLCFMALTYWQGSILNWFTAAMLTVDGSLWFCSRGGRLLSNPAALRVSCSTALLSLSFHHGCRDTSRELVAAALKKSCDTCWSLHLAPSTASNHVHWVAPYEGNLVHPRCWLRLKLICCCNLTAVSVFSWYGAGTFKDSGTN